MAKLFQTAACKKSILKLHTGLIFLSVLAITHHLYVKFNNDCKHNFTTLATWWSNLASPPHITHLGYGCPGTHSEVRLSWGKGTSFLGLKYNCKQKQWWGKAAEPPGALRTFLSALQRGATSFTLISNHEIWNVLWNRSETLTASWKSFLNGTWNNTEAFFFPRTTFLSSVIWTLKKRH